MQGWEVQRNRFPFRAALCKAHPSNTRAALAASPASKHSHSYSDKSWRAPDPNAVKASPNSATALQQGPALYPQGTVLLFPSLQHSKTHLLLSSPSGSQITAPLPDVVSSLSWVFQAPPGAAPRQGLQSRARHAVIPTAGPGRTPSSPLPQT